MGTLKRLLGNVIESYTIGETDRVLIADRDFSIDIKEGDSLIVELASGSVVVTRVLGIVQERGERFKIPSEMITTVRVSNVEFPDKPLYGAKIMSLRQARHNSK